MLISRLSRSIRLNIGASSNTTYGHSMFIASGNYTESLKLSLAKTLADKHRSSVRKMIRKYQTVVSSPHGTLKALEVIRPRGADEKPLVARFGGIEMRRQKHAVIERLSAAGLQ